MEACSSVGCGNLSSRAIIAVFGVRLFVDGIRGYLDEENPEYLDSRSQ